MESCLKVSPSKATEESKATSIAIYIYRQAIPVILRGKFSKLVLS